MTTQNAILALHGLQDSRCVYQEGGHVRLVSVASIKTDNWGAYISLDVVPAPGFEHTQPTTFTVTARWDALWVSDRAVLAPEIAWLLLTRPDLVTEIVTAAAQGQTDLALIEHIYELAYSTTNRE